MTKTKDARPGRPTQDASPDPDWAAEIADVKPLAKPDKLFRHAPAPAGLPGDDGGSLDDVDDGAFDPLSTRQARQASASKPPVPSPPPAPDPTTDRRKADVFIRHSDHPGQLAGSRAGLDDRARRKLARGEVRPTRTLDLHGHRYEEAWDALNGFLTAAAAAGQRCVLVIHGKGTGYGDGGQMGLIKSQMPSWLAGHPAALAYHTARPADGGSGAVYVLLRRQRG